MEYHSLGLGVIPLAPGRKVPLRRFPLQTYFRRCPTEQEVASWFSDGSDFNVGLCLGEPSDGVCVRDFDDMAEYEAWAADHPRLARTLPTVSTPRPGRHVYFRCDRQEIVEESGSRGIVKYKRGEVKATGYTVLPSSSVDGHEYDWLVPLDSLGYVKSVAATGLMPPRGRFKSLCGTHAIAADSGAEHGGGTHAIIPPCLPNGCYSDGPLCERVDRLVRIHQPTEYGQREACLWGLARGLKAVPDLREAAGADLRGIVEVWHQLAFPRIRTKPFWITLLAFQRCWERVLRPAGVSLETFYHQAEGTGIERFESMCRLLAESWAPDPFPLDQRAAAKVFGVGRSTVNRWLKSLRNSEQPVLRMVYGGCHVAHRCAEYRLAV